MRKLSLLHRTLPSWSDLGKVQLALEQFAAAKNLCVEPCLWIQNWREQAIGKLPQQLGNQEQLADVEAINHRRDEIKNLVLEAKLWRKPSWAACETLCNDILTQDADNVGVKSY